MSAPVGVIASPCRLSVFLSRRSTAAVILRRGPSAWAHLTLWDRGTDAFSHGQWFHGRVYERRCDLSPDGSLFIYFAAKHGRARDDDGIGEAWTAISRPPYFTALALWPNLGSWYGGGVFKTDKLVLLDASCGLEPHPKFPARPGAQGSVHGRRHGALGTALVARSLASGGARLRSTDPSPGGGAGGLGEAPSPW